MSKRRPAPARGRNLNIELLRLFAIGSIALFHSFQLLFAQAAEASMAAGASGVSAIAGHPAAAPGLIASMPVALGALGCINLLGAFGNHVFFAISGGFLIPSAARASASPGYAAGQVRRTLRRLSLLVATVAFYALVALAVNAWVMPVPGVGLDESAWLVGGLEFIWVYAALVAVTPIIGWFWRRCRYRLPVVVVLAVLVMGVNAYIAFVSPGEAERSLLEWRKLMSAASYLVAYLGGAAIAQVDAERRGDGGASRPGEHPSDTHCVFTRALAAAILLALVVEFGLAWAGRADLMVATSYKSTSLLSFALALAAFGYALTAPQGGWAARSLRARLVDAAAQGIVGFYILQSMFSGLWRPAIDQAAPLVAAACEAQPALLLPALLLPVLLCVHLVFDTALVVIALVIDALARRALFRLVQGR